VYAVKGTYATVLIEIKVSQSMSNSPFKNNQLYNEVVYKTLIESTLAIPWSIDWESKQFNYIGPQIEKLLGWQQASWKTVQDWVDRMHESDREKTFNFCVAQSLAGIDHEADYRALKADGSYIWIRDVVHVIRTENGEVDSLVGFMFDISERKKQEEQLEILQRQLEEFSYKDGLTGIANRRLFDEFFAREWQSAMRLQKPLSVLLIDLDYFKQYNDGHGHINGDQCLREIAQLWSTCCSRPRDLVSRFGGEEFAVVLPETNAEAAIQVAENLMQALKNAKLPHCTSTISEFVTCSMGVKTIVPTEQCDQMKFLELVDQNLYKAKQSGRNCYQADYVDTLEDLKE